MRVQVQQLDEEIRGMVRGQADSGHDGGVALAEAHLAIQELFGRIRNIKEKAEQSEHMVKKITADIKQMDNAKKHLTESIRTLERLRFLIANMEQLQWVNKHHLENFVAHLGAMIGSIPTPKKKKWSMLYTYMLSVLILL